MITSGPDGGYSFLYIAQQMQVDYGTVLCAADTYARQFKHSVLPGQPGYVPMNYWETKAFAAIRAMPPAKNLALREAIKNQVIYEEIKKQRSINKMLGRPDDACCIAGISAGVPAAKCTCPKCVPPTSPPTYDDWVKKQGIYKDV